MIGQQIGQYQVSDIIGEGGMATVYKAYHPSTDRYVAVKVLARQLATDDRFLTRFKREARVIAKLEHRSIVPIYDYGEHNGQPYIVMRLIESGTLRTRIYYQQLTLGKAARIVTQVAEALDYAHAQDIIHRDLKPSNILLDEHDNAYLTDFGIAKMVGSSTQVTASGVVGTPSYMSPEQCQGKELTGSSDLYALGAILYEIITGRPPYVAEQPLTVMYMHVQDPVPSVTDAGANFPASFDSVIKRALAKKPAERYPTAVDLAAHFRSAVEQSGIDQPVMDSGDTPPKRVIPSAGSAPPSEPVIAVDADIFDDESLVGVSRANDTYHPNQSQFVGDRVVPQPEFESESGSQRPAGVMVNMRTLALTGGGLIVLLAVVGLGVLLTTLFGDGRGRAIAPTLPPTGTRGAAIVVDDTDTPTVAVRASDTPAIATTSSEGIIDPSDTPDEPTSTNIPPSNTPRPITNTPRPVTNTPVPPTVTPTDSPTPTLTLTPTATITETPALTGANGLLAFTYDNNASAEIATIDANGTGLKLLTDNNVYDGEPDWKPDGGAIAFESRREGNGDIFVMTRFGTGLIALTTSSESERHPDWSPNGTKILYERGDGDQAEIWVMDADGSNQEQLTNNAFEDRVPQFSPDGTKVAYMTLETGNWRIAVMSYPDGAQLDLYDCPASDCRFPIWSPDGTQIAFNTQGSGGNGDDLYLLNVASGVSTILIDEGTNGRIMWSGDGLWMFFNRTVSGDTNLFRYNIASKKIEQLTFGSVPMFGPDWTP